MAEALRKSVGPGFEPGRWSFFPCRHSPSEQCLQNHYRALATPAYTELPLTWNNTQTPEYLVTTVNTFMSLCNCE